MQCPRCWQPNDVHLEREATRFRWLRAPATIENEGLADAGAANPSLYPDFTQELVRRLFHPPHLEGLRYRRHRGYHWLEQPPEGHETALDLPKHEALWRHFSSR